MIVDDSYVERLEETLHAASREISYLANRLPVTGDTEATLSEVFEVMEEVRRARILRGARGL